MTNLLQAAYDNSNIEPREWWFLATPATLAVAGGVLAMGLALLMMNWWRTGRDRVFLSYLHLEGNPGERKRPLRHEPTIVVEYAPPEGLRPAEIGVLLHEQPTSRDFTATIVDLAVREYISIDEESARSGAAWQLQRLRPADGDLRAYERAILDGLFASSDTTVLDMLTADHWFALRRAYAHLMDDAVRTGRFAGNPEKIRQRWLYIGSAIALAGIALVPILGAAFRLGFAALAISVCGLAIIATHRWMPRRTAKGSELLRRCLGFRMYVHEAERSRQEFYERQGIFAEYLPYAIVFGSTRRWAELMRTVNTVDSVHLWVEKRDTSWLELLGLLNAPRH